MDERPKTNLEFWNECAPVHERSPGYRLEEFRKGGVTLFPIERDEVRDIRGKSLLHLQCHFGLGTLSWARLGASVTGLDFSDQGIELARKIAAQLNLSARFVCSDIYTAKSVIAERFDIVFTSYGVLCWLPDLKKWAEIAAHFLKRSGFFYIAEFRPTTQIMAEGSRASHSRAADKLEIESSHFSTAMREFPPGPDYSNRSVKLSHASHEWMYTTGGIVTALIDTALQIEFVHEHPVCCFDMFPFMKKSTDGGWRIDGDPIPLTLSIRASQPR